MAASVASAIPAVGGQAGSGVGIRPESWSVNEENDMRINPCLAFDGCCHEAFQRDRCMPGAGLGAGHEIGSCHDR